MHQLFRLALVVLVIVAAIYLVIPVPGFPPPPPDSLVSIEPADTESIYRNAYYTRLSRSEIMAYYHSLAPSTIRINHPPEESAIFIRDLTPSSWLEELVHPGKDAFFINGFYPTKPTEQIYFKNVHYLAKITVHYYPSSVPTRLTVLALSSLGIYLLAKEYVKG